MLENGVGHCKCILTCIDLCHRRPINVSQFGYKTIRISLTEHLPFTLNRWLVNLFFEHCENRGIPGLLLLYVKK